MVRGPALRPLRASRFRRSRTRPSAERLAARIADLVSERQALREAGFPSAAIERNRVQLVRAQWELAHALIDRHLSDAPAQTAA
jgi:hypothetical protein